MFNYLCRLRTTIGFIKAYVRKKRKPVGYRLPEQQQQSAYCHNTQAISID
jgi:hypothetical protein